ncbi:MAG: MoxR family ATPase [Planctomycetes bacterium]|nr:MoxR family ATPase [Planctomycetota bacterium]MBL7037909.1 MoxR family ATPase [Pirellulaceae bacterium]
MIPNEFHDRFETLADEMSRVVVGYREAINDLLTGVFAGSSILLEAAPGLGKTVIGKALAAALSMKQTRIQFTPDLMPADIVGTNIIVEDEAGRKEMVFQRGPVFTHVLLADEINRATPKTQSALLEAMQEHHVTVAGETHPLEEPFFVVATQNPEDLEGTYRLPEAQIDRFGFRLKLTTLSDDEWIEVVRRRTGTQTPEVSAVLTKEDVLAMQAAVREVAVPREVCSHAARLVSATHPDADTAPEIIRKYVRLGSSPRGIQALILGAKVRALRDGRQEITVADVRDVATPALGHRLLLNFEGQADRIGPEALIDGVLAAVGQEAVA